MIALVSVNCMKYFTLTKCLKCTQIIINNAAN